MASTIDVSNDVLKGLDELTPYGLRNKSSGKQNSDDFVYIPSIELYVARHKTLYRKNWFETHKELQSQGSRMMTIPEFIEFLKYVKVNEGGVHKYIEKGRISEGGEWLDANFKFVDGRFYVNSDHTYVHEKDEFKSVPKNSELLDEPLLMNDKLPGISLEKWLTDEGHTKQGFPIKNIEFGDLYYKYPKSNNFSVAGFYTGSRGAYFSCSKNPSDRLSYFGVRAVRRVL